MTEILNVNHVVASVLCEAISSLEQGVASTEDRRLATTYLELLGSGSHDWDGDTITKVILEDTKLDVFKLHRNLAQKSIDETCTVKAEKYAWRK